MEEKGMKKKKKLLRLFIETFYLSAFTFGGGYMIVSLMKKKFVNEYHWIEEDEMLDLVAIAQSAPGAIAVNGAIVVGYKLAGISGVIVSVFGAVLPPFLIISVVSVFYEIFRDNRIVAAMLSGMQTGVGAVIISVVYEMAKGQSKKENRIELAIIMVVAYGTDMFAYQISNSLRMYFFKYNMSGRTDLITYIGYASTFVGFALVIFIQPFVKKTGKRAGIIGIEALAILVTLPMLITGLKGSYSVSAVMFTYIAIAFTWTINNMLSRSAVLDSANYAQMTLGVNGTALVNSTFTFVNKCCQAFSMFFSGMILSATGFNKDVTEQTPGCLKAILLLCTIGPIVGYLCSLIAMYFYPLTRKGEIEMQEKLDKMDIKNSEDDLVL